MRFAFALALLIGCGGDDDADDFGIGAECAVNDDCDVDMGQSCLGFKGGYCGLEGCAAHDECPENSACVTHDDGLNYCFRICGDKADCNANRSVENEANCSSSVDFVEPIAAKACVPPS